VVCRHMACPGVICNLCYGLCYILGVFSFVIGIFSVLCLVYCTQYYLLPMICVIGITDYKLCYALYYGLYSRYK